MSMSTDSDLVRVRVLKPMRQHDGMVRYPGEMIALPKPLAQEFKAMGTAEECAPLSD